VQPHRWQPTRLLCPWDSPGKNTGVGCHFLLQSRRLQNKGAMPLVQFEMQDTWVLSLGWENSLQKEMATHSSILAWKISWTEKPGRLQSIVSQRVGHD